MTESAAGIAEISCRQNAAIGEGIACFDFPIKQSVPAQGMNKRQIKHDCDFDRDKRNKTIDLKVLLLDADSEYASEDRSALADFPSKEELNGYDVILFGDVDPKERKIGDR